MGDEHRYARILSVGAIPELVSLRHEIMTSVGYDVFSTTEQAHAAAVIQAGECAVLRLCYSVADEWREALIRDFREHCPDGRIVAITNRPITQLPKDVDELVYGIEWPESLIDVVAGKKVA